MEPELRQQLTEHYRAEVGKLSQLLGRDLALSWPAYRDVTA